MRLLLSTLMLISLIGCLKSKSGSNENHPHNSSWSWYTPLTSSLNLKMKIETIAGYRDGALVAQDGIGTYALFYNPVAITTDEDFLYITDGSAIRKIHKLSLEVSTIVGVYDSVGSNLDGDRSQGLLDSPQGITVLGNFLYLTDTQNTIRKVNILSGEISTIAGNAGVSGFNDGVGSNATFNDPRGITTDGVNLYIADSGNHMIRKLNLSTRMVITVAGTNLSGNVNGSGSNARFNFPLGISTDGTYLYVTDSGNHNIRKISISSGEVSTFSGPTTSSSGSIDGTGQIARFNTPYHITADASHLYVADFGNCTIRKISKSTASVTTIAGVAGACSDSTDGEFGINNTPAPTGITADQKSLYIMDFLMVRKIL